MLGGDETSAVGIRGGGDVVPSAVVAIPVCNERAHIAECLRALGCQAGLSASGLGILLFLNNCTDGTADLIEATAAGIPWPIRAVTCEFAGASAGWARRRAMEAAADWLVEGGARDGVLLTTDADSRVAPDWVARNLAALAAGADAVAGRLSLDPGDAALLPRALHARGALESQYETLLIEIAARLDPIPGNPWPHHWNRSGASLATRLSTYRAIGGMPHIPLGEDRAFVEALLAHDLVVRHDPDLVVVTSGRLQGRAAGGVADTIRLRCDEPESFCDDRLERLERVVARTLLRARLRRLHAAGRHGALRRWARALGVTTTRLDGVTHFGAVHAVLQEESARLAYHPLRPSELARQIGRARLLVAVLRWRSPRARILAHRPGVLADATALQSLVKAAE